MPGTGARSRPSFKELPDTLTLVRAEVVHNHAFPRRSFGANTFLEDGSGDSSLHRQRWSHALHAHAGEQGGVRGPRLRGAEQHDRCPRRERARSGEREIFAPSSSTKTSHCGSTCSETITFHATLRNSSR